MLCSHGDLQDAPPSLLPTQVPLHVAVQLDCVAAIPLLLAAAPDTIAAADWDGRTALAAAIDGRQLETVEAILAAVPAAALLVRVAAPGRLGCTACCTMHRPAC